MVFLQSHGVSSGYATKIFKHYKDQSIEIVKTNPYRLAKDIFGIGFLTANKIAEKLGIAKNSELRAEAGILYVLNQLSDDGHVYYPYELLIKKCQEILESACNIKLDIHDMAALRVQISRLNRKLRQETNFKVERIQRNDCFYYRVG